MHDAHPSELASAASSSTSTRGEKKNARRVAWVEHQKDKQPSCTFNSIVRRVKGAVWLRLLFWSWRWNWRHSISLKKLWRKSWEFFSRVLLGERSSVRRFTERRPVSWGVSIFKTDLLKPSSIPLVVWRKGVNHWIALDFEDRAKFNLW
jgi:hypothetical protein